MKEKQYCVLFTQTMEKIKKSISIKIKVNIKIKLELSALMHFKMKERYFGNKRFMKQIHLRILKE